MVFEDIEDILSVGASEVCNIYAACDLGVKGYSVEKLVDGKFNDLCKKVRAKLDVAIDEHERKQQLQVEQELAKLGRLHLYSAIFIRLSLQHVHTRDKRKESKETVALTLDRIRKLAKPSNTYNVIHGDLERVVSLLQDAHSQDVPSRLYDKPFPTNEAGAKNSSRDMMKDQTDISKTMIASSNAEVPPRKRRHRGQEYIVWGRKCRWDGKRWRKLCQVDGCSSRAKLKIGNGAFCSHHKHEQVAPDSNKSAHSINHSDAAKASAVNFEKCTVVDEISAVQQGSQVVYQLSILDGWTPVLSDPKVGVVSSISKESVSLEDPESGVTEKFLHSEIAKIGLVHSV